VTLLRAVLELFRFETSMRASGKAVSGDYAVVTLFFAVRTITAECTGPV